MTILGIGCDIIYLPRIRQIIQRDTKLKRLTAISQKIMHPIEFKEYNNLLLLQDRELLVKYFGSVWCIKEAIYKSMTFKEQQKTPFFQMCKTYCKINDPQQNNRPILIKQDKNNFIKYHLSLSHDTEYIASYLIREKL
ncbi:hypothetical protein HANVADRAFT_103590 [Hanseniaspora valbyensis NRRL Y-1626]|uniref:4'-phosphopantetheinyl transferase domain-containing protein n=1 Tax=Hanseniaspora valbyensis NRRL Y-1626 TaxID=766949 RepID=A0A1B7TH02_9ASCO|nr:hypothetical protein HANVADRAFT_103590 [Hanseniaspora valbyensis NRRL Y-1626]